MSPVSLDALRHGRVVESPKRETHLARALAFLRKHPDDAWRATELAHELGTDAHTIGATLRRLRARGFIDKKGPYWFALSDPDAAKLRVLLAATIEANERLGPEDPADWAHLPHD